LAGESGGARVGAFLSLREELLKRISELDVRRRSTSGLDLLSALLNALLAYTTLLLSSLPLSTN